MGPQADGTIPDESRRRSCGASASGISAVKESLEGVRPASHLTSNRNVLLTRRDNVLYVHLHKDPISEAVKLKPITTMPRSATLLNTGQPIDVAVDMAPSDHVEQKAYLRLAGLPVNELANTVLVAKLEFDELPS